MFISEVSSNHNCNLRRSLEFIDTSARIGCDAVKFQLFKIDQLFAPEILEKSALHRARKDWELPLEFLPLLKKRCEEKHILFSCTPFYLEAVAELRPYVDFYKIASYELLWDALIIGCAQTGKPLVISTGMATLEEVQHAVGVFKAHRVSPDQSLSILHCVSSYPTPLADTNLAAIGALRDALSAEYPDVRYGWSDHSVDSDVMYRAWHHWDGRVLEFHLDLEGAGAEAAVGHCWLPEQVEVMIRNVRSARGVNISPALGATIDGVRKVKVLPSELPDREWRADPSDGLRPFLSVRKTWNASK